MLGCSANSTMTVAMTTEELKSAEKRAQDEALEKENMNKAMTAQEEKAISETYVLPLLAQFARYQALCSANQTLHPLAHANYAWRRM